MRRMPEYIGFMLTELDFASLRLNHVLLLTPAVADALEIGTKLIKIQRQTEVTCGHRRHETSSQGVLMRQPIRFNRFIPECLWRSCVKRVNRNPNPFLCRALAPAGPLTGLATMLTPTVR